MIEDHGWSYGLIQKAKVRPRHHQIHSENTCVLVPPHGGAGRLFRDFLFLPVGHRARVSSKNEQMESVGTVTGNGGGLGFA